MDFKSFVVRAKAGDVRAFDALIWAFQDMAFGYAYALPRDFDLAPDITQEAFFEAFRTIDQLVDFTRRLFAFGHSFLLFQIR